jgi:NADPH:quinone reductase-like Zn-dependent oxidoreductase
MVDERRIWRLDRAGSLTRLRLREEPLGSPRPGEVTVRVRSIGLNFADVFACLGLYSATPQGSFVPGLECAGEVEQVGEPLPGQRPCQPGDAVMVLTRFGAYATRLNVDARYLQPLPTGWTFSDGAAWPVQTLTAWYAVETLGAVSAGDLVLVHSAAGGVGLQALELLAARNATVVATVGNERKARFLCAHTQLPLARVIVRERRRFADQLDAALTHCAASGFDAVLDAILGPYFAPGFERLAPQGRYVVFGAADFMAHGPRPNYLSLLAKWWRRPRLDPLAMISRNQALLAFNLIWLWECADRLPAAYATIARQTSRPPLIGAHFPFDQAPQALRTLQAGQTIGKIVLEVG